MQICDTHNDFLTELDGEKIVNYIKKCKKNGAVNICSSYWSSERGKEIIKEELVKKCEILRKNSDFLLHLEDLWWMRDENDIKFVKEIAPFSCSLTWNNDNLLAGGAKGNGNLTNWGKKSIKELTENGIVIDVAHLNRKSFYEVIKVLKENIYCSHTGFEGVKKNKRNLTDNQIDKIVRSNGFIGLFFYDKCIKTSREEFSIRDIVDNLVYFTTRWGYDNIGIGSDFYGIENYPLGLSDYCDFENLSLELYKNELTSEQIDKILYKNFENFCFRAKNHTK